MLTASYAERKSRLSVSLKIVVCSKFSTVVAERPIRERGLFNGWLGKTSLPWPLSSLALMLLSPAAPYRLPLKLLSRSNSKRRFAGSNVLPPFARAFT